MARGWRVLDATGFEGTVGGARGRVTFAELGGSSRAVAAEDVAVILLGSRASLDATALHYAAKHDIAVLFADWKSVPFGGFYPWAEHTRVGARHLAQAQLSLPRRKNAWQQLIRAKVAGQASNLSAINPRAYARMMAMAAQVKSGDPTNIEGAAARYYWSRLFGGEAFARDADGIDGLNSMLNYGYTVLRGFGIRAVLGAGLSPSLGLFHRGRSNYFNLVDDLIEPFRPAIDNVVARFDQDASLDETQTKRAVVAAASQRFGADGTRIPAVLDDLAQQLGRYVEGGVARLSVPRWCGPPAIDQVADDGEE